MATGHPDYALQALNEYRDFIVQYLVKPFVENWREKFRKAVDALMAVKLRERSQKEQELFSTNPPHEEANSYVFLQTKGNLFRVDFDEIIYLEAAGGGDSIIVTEDQNYEVVLTLRKLLDVLPTHFIRISKSNVVNINRVISVNRRERSLSLQSSKKDKEIFISNTYYANFLKRLPLSEKKK